MKAFVCGVGESGNAKQAEGVMRAGEFELSEKEIQEIDVYSGGIALGMAGA